MGTTLTGTTPQDTYDSLIKVTDNGPLSGSLKVLTDGLGNNSTLSLSTVAASIGGTLAVTGATTLSSSLTANGLIKSTVAGAGFRHFYNNGAASIEVSQRSDNKLQLYAYTGSAYTDILLGVDGSSVGGNVGIGTSAPIEKATINGLTAINGASVTSYYVGNNNSAFVDFATNQTRIGAQVSSGTSSIAFLTASAGYTTIAERVRVTSDGLTFNGDTAAANALDDYEEGTWTMGVSFGGASVGVTTSYNTGSYTKIGRKVTVNGYLQLTSKGSSTGPARLTGLPFTIANTNANYSAPSLSFSAITFTNQFQGEPSIGTTSMLLQETTILGATSSLTDADFANTSYIILSLTYFV